MSAQLEIGKQLGSMDGMDHMPSGTADKRTPAILAQALYGLPPLNRQYDAQLLPYPSHYLIARQLNEPKFLRGLRGSK